MALGRATCRRAASAPARLHSRRRHGRVVSPRTAPLHLPFLALDLLGGGGGFLRSAAITAAGIAGGALLFEGIQSMFGHQDAVSITGDQPVMLGLGETVVNNHVSGGGSTDEPALAGYGPDLSGSEITDISTPDFSGNNASS